VGLNKVGTALPGLLRKTWGYVSYLTRSTVHRWDVRLRVGVLRAFLARQWRIPAILQRLTVRQVLSCSEVGLKGTGRLAGDLWLFRASSGTEDPGDEPFAVFYQDALFGWDQRVTGQVHAFDVPGGHASMLQEPQVERVAQMLQLGIDKALAPKS
jgi:thioesterase domain-containing protein